MFSFFKRKKTKSRDVSLPSDFSFLGADMHSHLVPGIDDGAPDLTVSLELARELHGMGFKKLITTPHVYSDFYRNDKETLQEGQNILADYLKLHQLDVKIQVAAEYFLDRYFLEEVLPKGLLTFGDNYVLVETSMAGRSAEFDDCLFAVMTQGYKPVLAHIERYTYEDSIAYFEQLKGNGVFLQLNALSVTGYYGQSIRHNVKRFLEAGLYDFCGSDLHHERHAVKLRQMPEDHPEDFELLATYPHFKNKTLL